MVEPLAGAPAPAAAPAVEPMDNATPPAPAVEPTGGQEGGLPDEVLQIPAFQGLMTGQPPALSAAIQDFNKRPEGQLIAQNKDTLMQAGIGFYRALDGKTGVIFNHLYLKPEDLQAADKAGQLASIAPPFDDVNQAVLASGMDNPVLNAGPVPGGPAEVAPSPPQSGSPIPPSGGLPAPAQSRLTTARLKNLQPGSPSSGARPGAGRLLTSILKNPV